jgi:hypothetical protein
MTTVNWEREPGEKVEEFVAAMLLLGHPHGNRITPSRGDRGVDIRVWYPDGYDIYQVKRYSRPLTAKQASEVKASWARFVKATLPKLTIRSWTLVTPWEPTNERLEWLEELTAEGGIRTSWMGGATLDGMASQRPSLVDYYFGDGGQRLQRLMADALQGGREVPHGAPAGDLLDAIVARHRSLNTALNDVDPFYRYELEIRKGLLHDQPWDIDLRNTSPVAYVHYEQFESDHYLVMRLVPLCAESLSLRPITVSAELKVTPGSPEQQAVEEFFQFGAPFQNMPGTITAITGPPGINGTTGLGRFSFMVASEPGNDRPDLEARLLSPDGSVLHTLDLIDVEVSQGVHGPGTWISGQDRGGALEFQLLLNGSDGHMLRINVCSLTGKTPADVLPAVQMVADLAPGTGVVLAVRGGKPVSPIWEPSESPPTANARWHVALLEALLAVQRHTYQRIVVPDIDATPPDQLAQILQVGRLLQGEQIDGLWTEVSLTVLKPDNLPPTDIEVSLLNTTALNVQLNGRQVPLDMQQRVLYRTARVANPTETASVQVGDTIKLVPGSDPQALIVAVPAEEP